MPELTIRSAGPWDLPLIADLYARLSGSCFADRFMSPRASASTERLSRFDAANDVVLLASLPDDPDVPIAEARYAPTGPDIAEFGIVVVDAHQGRGVGGALLAELLRVARQRGLERLSATVSGRNTRMLRLVDRLGWALVDAPEFGVGILEVSTVGGMPGWPQDGCRRILVESRSWFGSPDLEQLRTAGASVRRCPGPRRPSSGGSGRHAGCPLVVDGRCRLAEEADEIVNLLPGTVPECTAIQHAHEVRWPERLRPPAAELATWSPATW